MGLKDVWVLNAQTRSPSRPSLKYSSGGSGPLWKKNEAFCLPTSGGSGQYIVMPGQTKSTSMPVKFTERTTEKENSMKETSPKSKQQTFLTMTCSVLDFHVRLSRLLAKGEDLRMLEVLSFLKSVGLHRKNDHAYFYLRTSKAYYLTTKGGHSELSSPRWMKLGMTHNGKCLTLRTLECPRIGKECSLLDILEENADAKYFLSEKVVEKLKIYNQRQIDNKRGFRAKFQKPTDTAQALKIGGTGSDDLVFDQGTRVYEKKGKCPTLPTSSGGRHIPMICESED